jgi:ribonuclease HI
MIHAYCDGACRVSNPGETSAAFVVFDGAQLTAWGARYLGPELHTNNYVEFQGLLDLLKWAETTKISKLEIFCDSALVVNTVNGVWELKSEDLRPLWLLATALKVRGQHTLKHVDGHAGNEGNEGNELADWFCNDILNKEGK